MLLSFLVPLEVQHCSKTIEVYRYFNISLHLPCPLLLPISMCILVFFRPLHINFFEVLYDLE